MDAKGFFTAAQVTRMTGVPYQTLNYWAKIGLVRPSVHDAKGSGSRRVYDFQDLVVVRLALRLRQAGIFGSNLVKILDVTRNAGFDSPAKVAMHITSNGEVVVEPEKGIAISARKSPGQLFLNFEFDWSAAEREVRQLLHVEANRSHRGSSFKKRSRKTTKSSKNIQIAPVKKAG